MFKEVETRVLKTVTAMYFKLLPTSIVLLVWCREVSKKLESLWVFVSNININRIKIIEHDMIEKSSLLVIIIKVLTPRLTHHTGW